MSVITRRAAVVGALTSTVALAVPGAAQAVDPDQQIVDAYDQWRAAYDAFSEAPHGTEDPRFEAISIAEQKMMRMTPVTARGLAIQFVVFTSFGEFEATQDRHHDFAGTVERLAAVAPPESHVRTSDVT